MPLRPIDAIFVDPKRRLYVVYYRGTLWQLPRMKIDANAWQRRMPYVGTTNELYLSRKQSIHDPTLAQQLRTLHLPEAVRGCTLPKFESWWEVHGFLWLKEQLNEGKSPLAAHHEATPAIHHTANQKHQPNIASIAQPSVSKMPASKADNSHSDATDSAMTINTQAESTDIFADMLAELADEVRHHYDG